MHKRRKIHVEVDLYTHRHSYLLNLKGSRRPQVFVREGGKELCHTLTKIMFRMVEC